MSNMMQSTIDFANTPVVDIVNKIIVDSARAGVSDIHFDHSDECLKVRIRIDGILNDYLDIPNLVYHKMVPLKPILREWILICVYLLYLPRKAKR